MPLIIKQSKKTPLKQGDKISFRLDADTAAMLNRSLNDHPVLSRVANQCFRDALTKAGYARKLETAK